MSPEAAASCHDLIQIYPSASGPVAALQGVAATFPRGSLTCVIGPSGAGKSTFLRLVACLERPVAGEICIDGRPTSHLSSRARRQVAARDVGYVFQRPRDNLIDDLSVDQHLVLACRLRGLSGGRHAAEVRRAMELDQLGRHRPPDLSSGEQQRLAVAMAIAGRPALVVADEPTAELDPASAATLTGLLRQQATTGTTFVASSHDPDLIDAADQVLLLRHGGLAAVRGPEGGMLAALDGADRIQLPEEAVGLFPTRRARPSVDRDGLRLDRP